MGQPVENSNHRLQAGGRGRGGVVIIEEGGKGRSYRNGLFNVSVSLEFEQSWKFI